MALIDTGFVLQDVMEPTPDEAFEREYPDITENFRQYPPASIRLRGRVTPLYTNA